MMRMHRRGALARPTQLLTRPGQKNSGHRCHEDAERNSKSRRDNIVHTVPSKENLNK